MAKNILDWFDAWQLGLQNSSLASSAAGSQEHLGRLDDANTFAIGDDIEIQNAGEDVVEPSLVNSEKPVGEELSGGDLAWPIAQSVSGQSTGAFNASQEAKSDASQAGHHQPEAAREAASEILTALVPKGSVNPPVGTDGPTFSTLEKSNYTNSTSASYLGYGKSVSQSIPTDPLLSQQWHLGNTGGLLDLNVRSVWSPTEGPAYTGAGTRTVVIDDGFDYNHQDFDNYDQSLDFDFDGSDLDPFGTASDAHGTAVAGIIGAAADGTGAVGVAYGTSLVGYRTNGFISDFWLQNIRDTIHHAAMSAGADLANISQGIANDTNSEYGAGYNAIRFDEIETSIGTAVNNGRGGLGMTIIKSAGNSRSANYDVNADDWTNDTRQVVVAAVNQNGFVSSYSSYGAALLVSGFGTPGQVVTTDRTGAAGYNSTDFTSSFNGTSAAAPMVSGVVALMYDANAALGWRDVQTILGVSARQVGSEVGAGTAGSERYGWQFNSASTWNGGGQHFSNDYGYGLVDGHAAVRLAETWLLTGTAAATSGNQFTNTIDVLNASVVIPDGNATGTTFSGNAGFDDIVERVTVSMTFSTTFLADLELYLISPDGTVSELIDDVAFSADFNGTWIFESQAFRGERAGGAWSVRVVDDEGGDVLTVSDIVIRTYGAFTFNDRYVYTNEYSDYAGLFGHVTAVTDSNGGTDTVNASAVTTGSVIRLDGGVGAIDGIGTTFSNIENAIGGDGSDIIVGSIGNNQLFGMRGNDTLDGGGGIDTINAGTGDDTVIDANSGIGDFFDGGEGVDTLIADFTWNPGVTYDLTAGWMRFPGPEGTTYDTILNFENLTAGGAADVTGTIAANVVTITDTGSFHNNTISTLEGNDTISSGIGNDTINAGAGNDSVLAGDGDDVITDTEGMGSFDDDVYDGGNGIDTLVHNLNWVSSVTFDLTAGFSTFGGNRDQLISIENLTVGGDATVNGSEDNNVLTVIGSGNNVINGQGGDDLIDAGGGNDTLDGGNGTDTLRGGAGNDVLVQNFGGPNEILDGGEDNDTGDWSYSTSDSWTISLVDGTATIGSTVFAELISIENVVGGQLSDSIIGNGLDNVLDGQAGNDTLDGGDGTDTLRGGAGNDVLVQNFGGPNEILDGGEDNDTGDWSYSTFDNWTISLVDGTATIGSTVFAELISIENVVGGQLSDTIIGNGLDNVLDGQAGNDTLDGGDGTDTLRGGAGNDVLVQNFGGPNEILDGGEDNDTGDWSYSTSDSWTISLVDGTARIGSEVFAQLTSIENVVGGQLSDTIIGNGLDNVLDGQAGNDSLVGGAGNDTLNGGAGIDTLTGGAGSDTYLIETVGDLVLEFNPDPVTGGVDTVLSSLAAYTLTANVENLTLTGAAAINGTGNTLNNLITGNTAANSLDGGAGADTLNGAAGIDTLTGGDGNDTYIIETVGDLVVETNAVAATGGVDTVLSSLAAYTLTAHVENLTLTGAAAINGTGNTLNNVITGNTAANSLTGDAGNDTLNGGAGIDTMIGGAGSDTYLIETVGDLVLEFNPDPVTGGVDTVLSSLAAYTLTANVENLTLTGAAAINGTGNTLNNVITGNTAANSLDGGAGADTLNGAAGIDTLTGGDGNDTYIIETVGDLVVETNAVAATGGIDTVLSSLAANALTAHVENLTLTGAAAINGTGNTLNNVITGNTAANSLDGGAGADTLNGAAGIDTLTGGDGNDTYIIETVGDLVVETNAVAATGGIDTVLSSLAANALTAHVENLTLTGAAAINGTGNTLNNVITGNTAANSLTGDAGNDTLNGGAGIDTLTGGAGSDTYLIETVGDLVLEFNPDPVTGGVDTVLSSLAAYTLTANVENLTLTGAAAINGTGNTLNNVITGNTAANSLDGGAGADTLTGAAGIDTLTGGDGNDTYIIETVGDLVVETNAVAATGGVDTVLSSLAAYTLTAHVENLTLTGAAVINGTGNTLNNVITGNTAANSLTGDAGNDTLNGGAGIDTLIGGAGSDTYLIETVGDLVLEFNPDPVTGGVDTVLSSLAAYTLTANVENLTLTGAAAINGTGNTLNNVITGNTAANILNGGAGIDTLIGGAGSDTYLIETVGDLVLEFNPDPVTGGVDTVLSSLAAYTLTANVENLTLTGAAAINGTGNTLNNVITGNTAANSLSGGVGADTLNGAAGNDTLTGGLNADTFRFDSLLNDATNRDLITDFTIAQGDRIELENSIFTALTPTGTLASSAFSFGAAATNVDQRILYDSAVGSLLYDSDGSTLGGVSAIAFATLTPGLMTLTHTSFTIT